MRSSAPIKSTIVARDQMSMSELSIALEGPGHLGRVNSVSSSEESISLQQLFRERESEKPGAPNEEPPAIQKKSLWRRLWEELQCNPDSDEKEVDPFTTRRLIFVVLVVAIAVFVNVVFIPVLLTKMEEQGQDNTTDAPTASPVTIAPTADLSSISPTGSGQTGRPTIAPHPTPYPTLLPTTSPKIPGETPAPAAITAAFPPFTLAALENPDSPQTKAYHWLTADPNLNTYPSVRTLQRMSLATFFFATNEKFKRTSPLQGRNAAGDREIFGNLFNRNANEETDRPVQWTNASHWLSYDVHECFWYSRAPVVCDDRSNYRFLVLQDNGLVGRLPPQLGLLTQLQELHLSGNERIYGSIPSQISTLIELRSIQLSNLPQLSGTIPSTIASLHRSLETLHLRETPFLPKILPSSLGQLTQLKELLLDTSISRGGLVTTKMGILPTELGNLTSLESFAITGGELVGTLPSELGNLNQLHWMSVANTQIRGRIPPQYGYWSSMTRLELNDNRLTSNLPRELGYLRKSLLHLAVNGNEFVGTIPFQYSNLTSCKTMAFQANRLSGTVPLGLCYLRTNNIIESLKVDCSDGHVISNSSHPIQCACECDCY